MSENQTDMFAQLVELVESVGGRVTLYGQPVYAKKHYTREELARRLLACAPYSPECEWIISQLATKDVSLPPKPPKDATT